MRYVPGKLEAINGRNQASIDGEPRVLAGNLPAGPERNPGVTDAHRLACPRCGKPQGVERPRFWKRAPVWGLIHEGSARLR